MSYYDYYIVPKAGYTIEEACEEGSERTAEIAEYRGGRPTGMFFNASPENKSRLNPKFPPSYYARKQKVVLRSGVKIIDKPLFEEKIASGANPYFQLILIGINRSENFVENKVGLTDEQMIRYLVSEIRIFPSTKEALEQIEAIIDYMSKAALLVRKGETWARGIALKADDMMIDWKPGYDPVEWQIVDFVSKTGLTSRTEIKNYVHTYLGWNFTNNDFVDYKLDLVVKKGVLAVKDNNWYSYIKPLEPFVEKK